MSVVSGRLPVRGGGIDTGRATRTPALESEFDLEEFLRPAVAPLPPDVPDLIEPARAAPEIPKGDKAATDRRRATRMAAFGFVLVLTLHAWILSAGWVTPWPQYSSYYNRLSRSLLRGEVSLSPGPAAAHLALTDPYDPVANHPFRQREGVHDAVLFGGKFYLYWGPVPALLLTAVKGATGVRLVGDHYLVFAFAAGTMLFTTLLVRRLWGRFFPDQPAWTLFLGVTVAGLAAPLAYLMGRAAVYEAAILGGQFFLLAGLYLLCPAPERTPRPTKRKSTIPPENLPGMDDPLVMALMSGTVLRPRRLKGTKTKRSNHHADAPTSRQGHFSDPVTSSPDQTFSKNNSLPSPTRFLLAGACWAAAVGSRISLAVAVTVLGALVTAWIVRHSWKQTRGFGLARLAAFGLPLVAGAVALGVYNHARFGDWTEFGQRYQLTGANYHATPALFSVTNLWPNLYSYTLRPFRVAEAFPYLLAIGGEGTFPAFISLPVALRIQRADRRPRRRRPVPLAGGLAGGGAGGEDAEKSEDGR